MDRGSSIPHVPNSIIEDSMSEVLSLFALHPFFQSIKSNEGGVTVKTIKILFVILFSLAVAACGGGGGGGSSTAAAPTYSISGTVTGTTAVTLSVTGGTANTGATTDASDSYTVTGLSNGNYTVTPSKSGYTFTPSSRSVAINGANMTVVNFAVVKNSVLANISGAVSGTWVEGVTITISGDERGTAITDAAGSYSFGSLASGASYTFTPALAGYTFTPASRTVAVAAGSDTAVVVPAMTAASTIASYSISGTVSYPVGSNTGPIGIRLIPCPGCSSVLGTVADSSGAYTVRGLQPGTYTVVAEMDALGTGMPNATNPTGNSLPVNIPLLNPANQANVNFSVADPSPVPAPGTPGSLRVAPGNNSALVMYSPTEGAYGREYATSYRIYYGTTPSASDGSVDFAAQGDRTINFHVLSGLTNGDKLYFRMSSFVGTTESALTAQPAISEFVTIGEITAGTRTVSGTVTSPGTATGVMIVGLYSSTTGVYFTRIPSPVSPQQSYSIAGVRDGSYFPFAVIDANGNGAIDIGEINNINAISGLITVAGNSTGNDFALSSASATSSVNTEHYWDGVWHSYRLMLGVNDGTKRAVAVTLVSGPNVAVPIDMSANRVITLDPNARPNIVDSYLFKVTFSDATTEIISASVTGVLDSFATNLAASAGITPTFTWAAPTAPPASYIYRLVLWGDADQISWRYPQDFGLPSTTLSVLYSGAALTSGYSYQWGVQVRDANGNSATKPSNFTAVP